MQVAELDEVLRRIAEIFGPLDAERVPLAEAGGRHTAAEIIAAEDVPAFDRSTVDGYAVRARETFGAQEGLPALLRVAGEAAMGNAAPAIAPGECLYVPTGGMLPPGADAVVMLEQTEAVAGHLNILRQVAPGENVIRRGEDLRRGQVVLGRGRRLRAPELGLLASLGLRDVVVTRRPAVAVLSSGDELAPAESASLPVGMIRDANRPALIHLAARLGASARDEGILPDDYGPFLAGLRAALGGADMVVLSGGSSVGNRDHTARALRELSGGDLICEGLAVQPGKPTLLASCQGRPVLGLPGHPVSALCIFSVLGRALLRSLAGASGEDWRPTVRAVLARNVPSRPGRTELVRVSLQKADGLPRATPVFGRSGLLRTLAEADGLIWIPPESDGLPEGETVSVFLWD